MESFKALETVAFPCSSVCLGVTSGVVGKSKEVSLTREFHRANGTYKIGVYELIYPLCSLLGFLIVHLDCLGLLMAITDVSF